MASTEVPPAPAKLPVLNKRAPLPPRRLSFHGMRKLIHLLCVCVFFALPFFKLIRFDLPHQRFYFFGYELWISEFSIVFFSMMFLMFCVAALAMLYGRVYCGYLCPQMIFSEASIGLENYIARLITKYTPWGKGTQKLVGRVVFYILALAASVVLAFVFISYFVEPRDLLQRLLHLDIRTVGGLAGAVTTLLTLMDFLFLRQRFCTTVCPYGYLQGMLGDGNTLIVQYRDDQHDCIECKKCVRVCHMGIDIRNSPYQIECIHCGECIDACADVLGRLGKGTLIHYAWGEKGELLGAGKQSWFRAMGLRDAKKIAVMLVILCYATALFTALSLRRAVLVRIAPDRATMFRLGEDGTVYNRFRLQIANRGHEQATVVIGIEGLPGAHLAEMENAVVVNPGETLQRNFEIAAPGNAALTPGVNHFQLTTKTGNDRDAIAQTFIMPNPNSH